MNLRIESEHSHIEFGFDEEYLAGIPDSFKDNVKQLIAQVFEPSLTMILMLLNTGLDELRLMPIVGQVLGKVTKESLEIYAGYMERIRNGEDPREILDEIQNDMNSKNLNIPSSFSDAIDDLDLDL